MQLSSKKKLNCNGSALQRAVYLNNFYLAVLDLFAFKIIMVTNIVIIAAIHHHILVFAVN